MRYKGANSSLFVNGKEVIKIKAKYYEVTANSLCLGNISEDISVNNMVKTGLYGYVCGFSVDYSNVTVDDILDVHKY